MSEKDIIIVENEKKYEYGSFKDAVLKILGEDYYRLSEKEKYKRLELKTFMNASIRKAPVKDIFKNSKIEDIKCNQYIILNEITFFASLAKNKDIVLYQREDCNDLTKEIEKTNLEKISKEYIRINDCADEILLREIKKFQIQQRILEQEKQQKYLIDFNNRKNGNKKIEDNIRVEKQEQQMLVCEKEKWYKILINKIFSILKLKK